MFYIPVINSTNKYLLNNIKKFKSGDVCISEYQTKGYGKRNKKWFSPFGCNIYISMYWCFNKKKYFKQKGISIIITISIAEVLKNIGVKKIKIKWPNDLYLNNKKLAGIIIESCDKNYKKISLAIGIGINVRMKYSNTDNEIDQPWISLIESGINIDRNLIIPKLINKLIDSLKKFNKYGFMKFKNKWLIFDNYINKKVKLFNGNNNIIGINKGIDMHGNLLIKVNKQIKVIKNGKIILK
ncbi:biotin--[acetyl-CoA-carboxylase] ligase [Buchnera aphidicola (Neophyllaphis varicolor)]|uniref:biotin--[acetyl-CoA-carboxylase] ligase n=1 Tax=Buchnera aphidicola TaxID=9 RepID=UPI0031B8A818